ncbi:MAG: nuclear transport factor 2 family protein [Dehalococcoidia bacterium]
MEDLKSMLNRMGKTLEDDTERLEAKVSMLMTVPDRIEIENLMKTMVWAMDSGDKELWLGIWGDDIHYVVPQYDVDIRGRKAVEEFAEISIFTREARRFSSLSNIMIDVKGDTATGRDYYFHYGYAVDQETGKASAERATAEGKHFYQFRRKDGVWKITGMEVYVHRLDEEATGEAADESQHQGRA